jgi:hypothetical protein
MASGVGAAPLMAPPLSCLPQPKGTGQVIDTTGQPPSRI